MADTLDGLVLDVVDGEVLELEVEHIDADLPGRYGAREYVRLSDSRFAGEHEADNEEADNEEAAALMTMTYLNRRVRCFVEQRDQDGRIIAEVEVLSSGSGTADPDHLDNDDE